MVVVVDGDPDLQADLENELAPSMPHARVLANAGRRGLSGARNTGIDASRAPLIAFLDDDARADPEWLERLAAPFDDARVMVTGGRVDAEVEGPRPGWWPPEFDWAVGCSYPGQVPPGQGGELVPVRNVIGASMMVRRAAFDAVGPFSTDLGRVGTLPVGGEETELCMRVGERFGPGTVLLVPHARVHHAVPRERLTLSYLHRRCWSEGISKAVLGRLVRGDTRLVSERRYLTQTLPRAALGHAGAVVRGDLAGPARAVVLGTATLATVAGWARGHLGGATGTAAGETRSPAS